MSRRTPEDLVGRSVNPRTLRSQFRSKGRSHHLPDSAIDSLDKRTEELRKRLGIAGEKLGWVRRWGKKNKRV